MPEQPKKTPFHQGDVPLAVRAAGRWRYNVAGDTPMRSATSATSRLPGNRSFGHNETKARNIRGNMAARLCCRAGIGRGTIGGDLISLSDALNEGAKRIALGDNNLAGRFHGCFMESSKFSPEGTTDQFQGESRKLRKERKQPRGPQILLQ